MTSMVLGMSLSLASFAMSPDVTLPAGSHLQKLATITNTRDDSTSVLSVVLSSKNEVWGLYSEFTDGEDGSVDTDLLPIEKIESNEGAVLHEESGLKIFILQGHLDAAHGKAALQIRYLTNGIKHSYGSCKINAARSNDGEWSLFNAYNGSVVTEARAHTWPLGITTIENICP